MLEGEAGRGLERVCLIGEWIFSVVFGVGSGGVGTVGSFGSFGLELRLFFEERVLEGDTPGDRTGVTGPAELDIILMFC